MKHLKKLTGILLSLLMVFGLMTTAFAAGHTYEIYQIFTGDYANGVLSNVKWGQNGTGTKGETVSSEVLEALQEVPNTTSDTEKLAVITKYANLNTTPFKTDTATTYTGLPNGYYLVKDQAGTQNVENGYYTLYIVQVVNGTLTIDPKGDVPEAEKKILDKTPVDVNEASIGDKVSYRITGTLPTNLSDYNTYYYVFTDTLSKGLTYNNDVAVTVNGVDVTNYFYVSATAYSETDGTTITVGIQDLLALNQLDGVTVTKDSQIVVTYSATLNENAVIAGEGNPNDVKLAYSNDPNNSGEGTTTPPSENPDKPTPSHPTGETPEDTVVTYTTELTILKTDDRNQILPGAEFTLTGEGVNIVLVTENTFTVAENGDYWLLKNGTYTQTPPDGTNNADYADTETKYTKTTKVVAKGTGKTETNVAGTVDPETGRVTFTGLGAGTYTITETKTPAGYNTIAPVTFTLTFNAATKTFSSDNMAVVVDADNKLDTTIVNFPGATLPTTGGMGTTLFYVVGAILALGAGVLLVTKRRMKGDK